MKCPNCNANQKHKEGMSCKGCGYVFTLDPKTSPYVSDAAMHKLIDTLSGGGQLYFTYYQLYAAVRKLAVKCKNKLTRKAGVVVVAVFLSVVFFLTLRRAVGWSVYLAVEASILVLVIWYMMRSAKVSHEEVTNLVNVYRDAHPIDNLVDGKWFARPVSKETVKEELFQYAPDRILIVQRDDMADMLVRNRFHFENKTIVVSANKYPKHVFAACKRFLEKRPDIPVEIVHDLSKDGLGLYDKLMSDPSWNLEGKNVKDLGIFPDDVVNMKNPVWIPTGSPAGFLSTQTASGGGKVQENLERGMRMPVDFAPPSVLMGSLAVAVAGGLLLMSTALFAEEQKRAMSDTGAGFG